MSAEGEPILRVLELDRDVAVRSLVARERLGRPFEVELDLEIGAPVLTTAELEDVLLAPAVLAFAEDDDAGDAWHGMLAELEATPGPDPRRVAYRARLVPRFWRASLMRRSRFFRDLALPDVLRQVLRGTGMQEGVHFRLELSASYPTRAHVVQYEESDLDFAHRWMEREGMFYFLEHGAQGEVLVVTDGNAGCPTLAGRERLRFDPRSATTGETVRRVSVRQSVVPEFVVARDYHPHLPGSTLQSYVPVDLRGLGVQAFYGDHLLGPEDAKRIARIRGEEARWPKRVVTATSTVRGLRAGHRFELVYPQEVPSDELDGLELLVVGVRHRYLSRERAGDDEGLVYSNELELVPAAVPYRQPRTTPWPRIDGVLPAVVAGPAPGTPAPLDEEGRYQVVLPFDTEGAASCWVRMIQPYAGAAYGHHSPLHMGTEVLVAHLGGDPDRPIIVGAAPNPATPSPVTRDNATQSVTQTHNGIVMEWEDDA